MIPYVTPERFRTMGFGVKLDAYDSDAAALRSILNRASARVDAALKTPMLPSRHDMRGGTIVGEQSRYRLPRGDMEAPPRRVYLKHSPIAAVSLLRIKVTNTQYVSFDVSQLFVIPQLNCVEITSLAMTANGLFGAFVVPVIGLSTPIVECNYTYGYDFTIVDEQLEPTDGQLYRAQNQWWTADDVTVKVDGATTTTGFTINRDEGTITFDENQAAETVVTASYHHKLPVEVAQATGIVAADIIGQEGLANMGMTGLRRLKVAEIEAERDTPRGTSVTPPPLPPAAMDLIEGLSFITVR